MRLDKTTALAAVGALFVILAFCFGVLYLTPQGSRDGLLHSVGGAVAPILGVLATAVAGLAAKRASQAHDATQAQAGTLEVVMHQTNGQLTQRLSDSSAATVAAVAQLLEQRGVTTSQLVVPALPAAPAPADFPPAPAPVVAAPVAAPVAPPAPAPAYSVPAPLTVPATSVDPSVAAAAVPASPVVPSVALAPQGS